MFNFIEDNAIASVDLNCYSMTKKTTKTVKPGNSFIWSFNLSHLVKIKYGCIVGKGADPNLIKCKKKKLLRIEKKLVKNPNFVIEISAPEQKSLEDFIRENDSVSTDEVQKLRVSSFNLNFEF